MTYDIISRQTKEGLIAAVNEALKTGWQLHGSCSLSGVTWSQAVVKGK